MKMVEDYSDLIIQRIEDSIGLKERIKSDPKLIDNISKAAKLIGDSVRGEGKVIFCGNGGSASDALHLAAELVGRFQKDRPGLAAISLNADVAILTSISNDFGYDSVFERQVDCLLSDKDVLFAISTSGQSENVYKACMMARKKRGKVVSLLGRDGGKIKKESDISIIVPDNVTARIQESHIMIGHIICELIEK